MAGHAQLKFVMTECWKTQIRLTGLSIKAIFSLKAKVMNYDCINRAASSEFVSSSIPSWQILTAHAQPFRGARDLAFCLKVPLGSLLVWASSEGSGETARMRRLAWTLAARIGDKYQIRLMRSNNKLLLKLFDCLIRPILYGSEIWICDFNVKESVLDKLR